MASLRSNLTMSDSLAVSYPKVKEEYGDYNFKVVLIGDASVGKTSALKRFRYGTFSERPANTIGVDFTNRTLEIEGKIVQLNVWDTAGQERYRTITQSYYRYAHGVVLAFDLTRERSFTSVGRWLADIKQFCGDVPVLLIGTKLDLVQHSPNTREVETSSAEEIKRTRKNIIEYAEVSAREGTNIESAFITLAEELKRRADIYNCTVPPGYSVHPPMFAGGQCTVDLDKSSEKKGCCS